MLSFLRFAFSKNIIKNDSRIEAPIQMCKNQSSQMAFR